MKFLKVCWGLVLFATLVVVVQLADPPENTPTAKFQRLPDVSILNTAAAEAAAKHSSAALLLLDYVIENKLPEKEQAIEARKVVFAQLATENTPVSQLKATGWAAILGNGGV